MRIYILIFVLSSAILSFAQSPKQLIRPAKPYKGEIIPIYYLDEVDINAYVYILTQDDLKKYAKLIRNVKVAYPYAKKAGVLLRDYNNLMIGMSEKERKRLMKQAEKDIEREFTPSLKKLTKSQGKILLRLVDRETGSDSYSLVKELRGSLRAFFYQSIGRIFGYNLRTKYDPLNNNEDFIIEKIIFAIESKKL